MPPRLPGTVHTPHSLPASRRAENTASVSWTASPRQHHEGQAGHSCYGRDGSWEPSRLSVPTKTHVVSHTTQPRTLDMLRAGAAALTLHLWARGRAAGPPPLAQAAAHPSVSTSTEPGKLMGADGCASAVPALTPHLPSAGAHLRE